MSAFDAMKLHGSRPHLLDELDRVGRLILVVLTVFLPFFLVHLRPAAEAVVAALAIALLLRIAIRRNIAPLLSPWFFIATAYWAWLVLVTILAGQGPREVLLALAWIRFPLAAAALAGWVLVECLSRRVALWSLALCCLWIALECWLQLVVGHGLSGPSADIDGIITGPFTWARAGPFLAIAMWPPLIFAYAWLGRQSGAWPLAGLLLFVLALATLVIIGQRMALLQALAITVIAAALLPQLRQAAATGCLAALLAVAVSPLLAPEAFRRLAIEMPGQIAAFPGGPYGEVWAFWLNRVSGDLWTGLGHLSFAGVVCPNGSTGCHPHSHYLEAFVEAGIPGFLLFIGMSLALFVKVARVAVTQRDLPTVGLALALLSSALAIPALKSMTFITNIGLIILIAGMALAFVEQRSAR
jgi:hypothetical protein